MGKLGLICKLSFACIILYFNSVGQIGQKKFTFKQVLTVIALQKHPKYVNTLNTVASLCTLMLSY